MPPDFDPDEQEAVIRAEILKRQTELNATQRQELAAAKGRVYAALKVSTTQGGNATAQAVRASVIAMKEIHRAEQAAEAERVRLELGAINHAGPARAVLKIIVHQRPGWAFGGPNDDESVAHRNRAADLAHARSLIAEAEAAQAAAADEPSE